MVPSTVEVPSAFLDCGNCVPLALGHLLGDLKDAAAFVGTSILGQGVLDRAYVDVAENFGVMLRRRREGHLMPGIFLLHLGAGSPGSETEGASGFSEQAGRQSRGVSAFTGVKRFCSRKLADGAWAIGLICGPMFGMRDSSVD